MRDQRRRPRFLTAALTLLALPADPVRGQAPSRPGAEAAPPPLSRYVPREDLSALFEFDGLDAHAGPWRRSAAFKVLNETKTGALLEDLIGQGLQAVADQAKGPGTPTGPQLADAVKAVFRGGVAVGVSGKAPERARMVIAFRGGERGPVRRVLDFMVTSAADGHPVPQDVAGRSTHRLGKGASSGVVWFERGDAVVTSLDHVEAVVAVIAGKKPGAEGHPARVELTKDEDGFEPFARGFLDPSALPPPAPQAAALGLDGVRRIDLRWGVQDDALLTVVRVAAPAPRRGLLALLDGPTFDKGSLPPLPAGLSAFTAASVNPVKWFDQFDAMAADEAPNAPAAAKEARETARRVRRDLLPHLGPKWAFYSTPDPGVAGNPLAAMLSPFGGLTLTADTEDPAAVGRALAPLVEAANRAFRDPKNAKAPGAPAPEVRKAADDPLRYVLDLPPGSVPPGPLAALQPTLVVGKTQVVVSSKPPSADAAIALAGPGGARWTPTGAFEPMTRRLPADLVLLNVSDPRTSLPTLVASLPSLVPFLNAAVAAQGGQRPGGPAPVRPPFALRVDPDRVPSADELSARLFPSSLAVSVDRRGLTLVTREAVPSVASPASAGLLVGLTLPAVQSAREAARRAQCTNNLKQIALAVHNYHSVHGTLPPVALKDRAGKPLLSWRVAILPYLGAGDLYKRFHLDEPWDSPHNKALISSMPPTYACPSRPTAGQAPGMASYRVFTGPATPFPPDHAVKFTDITDGTSMTLLAVETREGVPWTRPEDLEFGGQADPAKPQLGAGSNHPGGFVAAFLDGSVRFLKTTLDPKTLRALITRDGKEVIAGGNAGF